ncbi:MAG: 4-hydroxy-tetrahydrodipicolinate reductase [Chlamydiae bacterium]|nr:4-hydroxy-tetrahydrodipicolinate reductase [Chlamydiota bacterium]MBI3265794.1 4-hydroxy-tetrahydrodipicolinate reductase [Chlamydiota bacterium]
MPEKIKIVVHGACGKMGRQIIQCALNEPSFEIVGAVEHSKSSYLGQEVGALVGISSLKVKVTSDLNEALEKAQAIIDFSQPEASITLLQVATQKKIPLVVGTTGFTEEQNKMYQQAGLKISCVKSPNMSVGINLLFKLVEEAARVLGESYDVEVVEAHHRLKKDAPSGTAHQIVRVLAETLHRDLKEDIVYGRKGMVGERKTKEIGVFAVRAGDIVGDHTVLFAGASERVELIHRAHSREPFARGALRAAKFVVKAKTGLYDMRDVLGIYMESSKV